ncbi:hypothetical protein HNQ93_003029 [Hymenobacter luteus]|uniref:STAS/SEC14 domain-containing protein n=2 Tax=Hymenobacter TaxID=89966 RepID=A0A7W9T316_9BACT|nr:MULTISPECIES: hypothetical protein [Hymenobacter]MBB4603265.1 hypothetical protein [Hymenobacter latericoloratus]MBB6060163.1 hypothetical protein [Hymenobacter luteus]
MLSEFPTSCLEINYRPDLAVFIIRWLRQPTPEELQAGYLTALKAAQGSCCRFWLVDGRRRADANQKSSGWMMETFFPLMAARLGSPIYMAYLFMPSHLADLEADASVPPLSYFDDRPYLIRRFTSEQSAMMWLMDCRQASR